MRKIYIFSIGIVLLILAGWGFQRIMRPHRNVDGETADAVMKAETLYAEFYKNEPEANKKWVGRVIVVTGIVSSATETGDYFSVSLHAAPEGSVNCSILKKDLPAGSPPQAGDSVSIKGKCSGYLMDVNLLDCVLKK